MQSLWFFPSKKKLEPWPKFFAYLRYVFCKSSCRKRDPTNAAKWQSSHHRCHLLCGQSQMTISKLSPPKLWLLLFCFCAPTVFCDIGRLARENSEELQKAATQNELHFILTVYQNLLSNFISHSSPAKNTCIFFS